MNTLYAIKDKKTEKLCAKNEEYSELYVSSEDFSVFFEEKHALDWFKYADRGGVDPEIVIINYTIEKYDTGTEVSSS